jgi:hypothetical protein
MLVRVVAAREGAADAVVLCLPSDPARRVAARIAAALGAGYEYR